MSLHITYTPRIQLESMAFPSHSFEEKETAHVFNDRMGTTSRHQTPSRLMEPGSRGDGVVAQLVN
jgi:hypothetical protein